MKIASILLLLLAVTACSSSRKQEILSSKLLYYDDFLAYEGPGPVAFSVEFAISEPEDRTECDYALVLVSEHEGELERIYLKELKSGKQIELNKQEAYQLVRNSVLYSKHKKKSRDNLIKQLGKSNK